MGVNPQNNIPFTYSYTRTVDPGVTTIERNAMSVVVTYQNPPSYKDYKTDQRFFAALNGGKEIEGKRKPGPAAEAGPLRTAVLDFSPDLVPKGNDVLTVRLQTRPYDQWIEFRNVSLVQGTKTDVQVVTSDDSTKAAAPPGIIFSH